MWTIFLVSFDPQVFPALMNAWINHDLVILSLMKPFIGTFTPMWQAFFSLSYSNGMLCTWRLQQCHRLQNWLDSVVKRLILLNIPAC